MNQLTPEQSAALHGEPQTELVDPTSGKVFVLIEKSLYDVRINAANVASIQRGIEDMKAGRGMPLEEAREASLKRLREHRTA
jgi:predicted transcriptional regulator